MSKPWKVALPAADVLAKARENTGDPAPALWQQAFAGVQLAIERGGGLG